MLLSRIFAISLVVLVGGCATFGPPPTVIDSYCYSYNPIKPSRKDVLTDGTKRQIVTENAKWRALCELKK